MPTTNSVLNAKIVLRNDTSINWKTINPILMKGEIGVEMDSRKMKVGDGMSAWNDLDYLAGDEISIEDLPLGKVFKFTKPFGKYVPSASGNVEVDATEMSITDLLINAYSETVQPKITQPSCSINCPQAKAYEVGTKITPSYSVSFNKGKYEYGPDTGVTVVSYQVTDGTTPLDTATGSYPELTVADGMNYKLTATVTYSEGVKPNDNLGGEATVEGIAAGSCKATSGAITGYRAMFVGSNTAVSELNSANIRGLTNVGAARNYNLNVVEGARQVIIALPAGKTLKSVKDQNAFGTDIVASFVMSNVDVEGKEGYTAQSYNVYAYAPDAALSANVYEITIA